MSNLFNMCSSNRSSQLLSPLKVYSCYVIPVSIRGLDAFGKVARDTIGTHNLQIHEGARYTGVDNESSVFFRVINAGVMHVSSTGYRPRWNPTHPSENHHTTNISSATPGYQRGRNYRHCHRPNSFRTSKRLRRSASQCATNHRKRGHHCRYTQCPYSSRTPHPARTHLTCTRRITQLWTVSCLSHVTSRLRRS